MFPTPALRYLKIHMSKIAKLEKRKQKCVGRRAPHQKKKFSIGRNKFMFILHSNTNKGGS